MRIFADLHIHGRCSRAVSKDMLIPNMEKSARIKGINLLGTGDAQHPEWQEHLRERLVKERDGIFFTATGFPFVLTTEVSLMYKKEGKGRRVHLILLIPSFIALDKLTAYLKGLGRIDYDGRPIFKVDCEEFVHKVKMITEGIEVIPAHIWTPWFSLFGSKSGFDSVEQCFGSASRHIHALETGLSSDPPMNWRISQLDRFILVSFSDSHSPYPWRMGREATIFDMALTYQNLIAALRTRKGYVGTIEVDPAYGKYHFDGHKKCGISRDPTLRQGNACPVCKRELTIGVLSRVEELADRKEGYSRKDVGTYRHLLPLHELLSFGLKKGMASQAVATAYRSLLAAGRDEFSVLLALDRSTLLHVAGKDITGLILANREGSLSVTPGYDGVYGVLERKI